MIKLYCDDKGNELLTLKLEDNEQCRSEYMDIWNNNISSRDKYLSEYESKEEFSIIRENKYKICKYLPDIHTGLHKFEKITFGKYFIVGPYGISILTEDEFKKYIKDNNLIDEGLTISYIVACTTTIGLHDIYKINASSSINAIEKYKKCYKKDNPIVIGYIKNGKLELIDSGV